MKTYYGILLAIIFGSLAACLPEPLPVNDIPELETRMVISSQMVPDRGLIVAVTKSIGALEAGRSSDIETLLNQIVVDNALVTLHYDDEVDTLTGLGYGIYGNVDVQWQEGKQYELKASANGLPETSSVTNMVSSVVFDDAYLSTITSGNDSIIQINYSISDPAGKNYYVISVQRYSTTQQPSDLLNPRIFNYLLEDDEFENQRFSDEFKVVFPRFHPGDTVALFLSSVNEEYFRFLKMQKDNEFSLVEFISEPVNYPSNIEGGYGFFNLHTPDVKIFGIE